MYRVIDSYGSNIVVWRWSMAIEWLAACSPSAAIVNRFSGRVLASRVVVA
jgi:hypothetical protein